MQKLYPWDEWLNRKKPYELKRGKDFSKVAAYSVAQQLRNAATTRGKRVSIEIINNNLLKVKNLK